MKNKIIIIACLLIFSTKVNSQTNEDSNDYRLDDIPFTVEFSYKIKWGYFDEFFELYKKNHWPFIKSAINEGLILKATVHRPFNHSGENDRWDLRTTITYKNILIAHGLAPYDIEAKLNRLFPDKEKFFKEEKRRFELIEEHLDVEIYEVSLD